MVHVHKKTSRIGKAPRWPHAPLILVKMWSSVFDSIASFPSFFLCWTAALFIPTVLLSLLNPFRWVLDLWEFLRVLGGLKFNESFTSQINQHSLSPFPPSPSITFSHKPISCWTNKPSALIFAGCLRAKANKQSRKDWTNTKDFENS